MKIKFLKDSPDGNYKKGKEANINDWRANYWIRTGVAEEAPEKKSEAKTTTKAKTAPKKAETKNAAPKTENK